MRINKTVSFPEAVAPDTVKSLFLGLHDAVLPTSPDVTGQIWPRTGGTQGPAAQAQTCPGGLDPDHR